MEKAKASVWGIWVPQPGAVDLSTLRTTRKLCLKDYTKFYTAGTRPKLTWAQLYKWGWRCVPVALSFNKPSKR